MPSSLTVVVHSARVTLPTDGSYTIPNTCVEWSFGTKSKRTKAARGSQPVFEETFKAEVADDASLSTEPLYIRLLDRDVPREETLGSLMLSLDIMLRADSTSFNSQIAGGRKSMSGWFPLWDSLDSTPRAWLHVTVEVRMFSQPGAAGAAGTSSSTLPVTSSGSVATGPPPAGPRSRAETGSSRAINSKSRRDMAQPSSSLAASGLSASAEVQDGTGPGEAIGTGTATGAGAIPIFFADAFEHRLYPYAAYCGFVEELIVCPDPAYSSVGAAGPLSGLAANSHQLSTGGTAGGSASLQTPGLAHSLSTGLGGAPAAVGSALSSARRVNEARSLLLYRMSSQLRASVAKKAALLGANAILGFSISFDVEGDSGLAGRARGTAVCTYRPRLEDATAAWAYALELLNPERARARSIETPGNEGDAADNDADGVLRSTSSRLYNSAVDGTGRSSVQSIEGSAGAAALAAALGIQRQPSGFRVADGPSGGLGYATPLSDATPAAPTQATKALPMLNRQGSGDSSRRAGTLGVGTAGAKREGSAKDVLAPGAAKGGLGSKGLSLSASATQLQVERQKEAAARAAKEHRRLIRELTKSLKDEKRYCREERRLLRRSWALQEVALRQTLHALYWRTMDAPQHRYNRWASTGVGAYGSEYGRSSNVDLLTLKTILPGTRLHLGGLVAVRSVRYLGRLKAGALSDQETRDTWWAEVRAEVRDHARKLGCTQIIGYSESTAICNDAIVLSAVGTAARLKQGQTMSDLRYILTSAASRKDRKETAGALQERTSKRSRSRAALRTAELETQAHMSGGDGSGPAPSAAALSNARRAWHPDPTRRAWYLQTQASVLTAAQAEATHAADIAARYEVQAPSAGAHPPGLLHVNSSSSGGLLSSSPGRVTLSAPTTDAAPTDTLPPLFASVEGGNETAAAPQPVTAAPPALHMAHLRSQNSFGSLQVPSGFVPTGSSQGGSLQAPSAAEGPLSAVAPASLQSESALTMGGTFGTPKSYTPGLQTPGGTGVSTAQGSASGGLSAQTPAAITQSAMVSTAISSAKALRLSIDVNIGRAIALNAGLVEREHTVTGVLPCFVSVDPTCAPGNTAQRPCSMLHLPYTKTAGVGAPFHGMSVSRCRSCARAAVPSVLLSTADVPSILQVTGTGMFIEATAVRRKDSSATGEAECVKLSEELLFLEYAMHQQVMLKLRAAGRNALFGVRTNVAFRGSLIIGSISGTAVLLDALAPPAPLQLRRGGSDIVKLLFDGLSKLCESSRRSLLAATAHARAVERILRPLSMAVLIDTRSKYDVIVRQGKKLQVAVLQVNAKKRKALLQGALAALQSTTPAADAGLGLARAARTSIGTGNALTTVPASPSHIGSGSGPSTPSRKLSNSVELDSAVAEGGMIVLPPTVTSAASGALVAEGWSAASQYAADRGSPAQVLSPQLLHDRMRKSGSKPKSASRSHRDRHGDKEREGRDKDREGKRAKESRHSKHRGRDRRTRKTSNGGHSSDSSSSSSSSSSSGRSGASQGSPSASASAGGGVGGHSRRQSAGAGSSGPSSAIGTGGVEGGNGELAVAHSRRDRDRDRDMDRMDRLARRYRGSFDHSTHAGGASAAARGMGELSRPSSVMSETSTASKSSFRSRSRSGDSSSPSASSTSSSTSSSSSSSTSTSTSSTDSSTDSGWSSDGSSRSSETDSLSEGLSMSSTSSSSSSSGSSTSSSSSSSDSYGADRRRHHHHGHRHESDSSSSSSDSSRSSRSYSSSSGSSSSDSSSGSSGARQRKKRRHRHRHGHGKHGRRSGADRGERSRRMGGQGESSGGGMEDVGSEDEGPMMNVGRARAGHIGRGAGVHGNAGASGAAGASDSLRTYVIEIEDEQGEDVASVLADVTSFNPPPGVTLLSTSTCHGGLSSSLGEGPLLHPLVLPPAVQDVAERNSGLFRSHPGTTTGDVSTSVPHATPVTDSPDRETGTSTPQAATGQACTDKPWDMEALARVQSRAERVSGRRGPGQGGTGLDGSSGAVHSGYRSRVGQGSSRTPGSAAARLQAGLASTRSLTSATMTRMAVLSAASPAPPSGGIPSGYAAGSTGAPEVQWTDVPTWHVCARQAALLLPAPVTFSLRFRWDDLTLVHGQPAHMPASATASTQDLQGAPAALAGLPPDMAALWIRACDASAFAADVSRLETPVRRPGLVIVPPSVPVQASAAVTDGNSSHLATTGLHQSLGLGDAGSDLHRQRVETMSDAAKCARVRNVALTALYTLVAPLSPCTVCNLAVSLTIPESDEVEVQVSCGIVREATVAVDTRAEEGTLKSVAASTSVLVAAPLAAQQALAIISAQSASSTAPRSKTTYQVGGHAGNLRYMDIATLAMRAFQRSLWPGMPIVQSQQAAEPKAMEDVLALWPNPSIPVAQSRHERSADPHDYLSVWLCALPEVPGAYVQSYLGALHLYVIRQHAPGGAGGTGAGSMPGTRMPGRTGTGTGAPSLASGTVSSAKGGGLTAGAAGVGTGGSAGFVTGQLGWSGGGVSSMLLCSADVQPVTPAEAVASSALQHCQVLAQAHAAALGANAIMNYRVQLLESMQRGLYRLYAVSGDSVRLCPSSPSSQEG